MTHSTMRCSNKGSGDNPRGDGAVARQRGGVAVASFYRFVPLDGLEELRSRVTRLAETLGLKGTVLLAKEGINATLCGPRDCLETFVGELEKDGRFRRLPARYSAASLDNPVFYRLKVRTKPEILTFGREGVDVAARTGEHVDARRWNELLDDPDVTVVDVRNGYEIGLGAFPGAIDPDLEHFREFPGFVRRELDPDANPRVAMYCTGGIRCEKASAWLLKAGCGEVYQLDGGILRYLETVPEEENRWQGECFVFDQRVSVDANLAQGSYRQCFACRAPLSAADLESPNYRQGVHCPRCHDDLTGSRRRSLEERQRQVELAEARGDRHIGGRAG